MGNINYGKLVTSEITKKLSATSARYTKERIKREDRGTVTSCELIWERCLQEFHPTAIHLNWSKKDMRMMKLILGKLPDDFNTKPFLEAVLEYWIPIVSGSFKQYPNTPQLQFLSRFLSNFTEFYTSLTIDGIPPQASNEIKSHNELSEAERMELASLRKRFKEAKPAPKKRKILKKINTRVANVCNTKNDIGDWDD